MEIDTQQEYIQPFSPALDQRVRRILSGQNIEKIRRAASRALRDNEPEVLADALCRTIIAPAERLFTDKTLASNIRRSVQDHNGRINSLITDNHAILARHPDADQPRNVTTITSAVEALTVAQAELVINAHLALLHDFIQALVPGYQRELALDEVLTAIHTPRSGLGDADDFLRYTVGNSKSSVNSRRVLHWNVACVVIPGLSLKYPLHISLWCNVDKNTGERLPQGKCPSHADVVREFTTAMERLDFTPRRWFMDRGFLSYAVLDHLHAYREREAQRGRTIDFVIPAIRWGSRRPEVSEIRRDDWADYLRKGKRNDLKHGALSIKELVADGHHQATIPMQDRPSWKFRCLERGDEYAPEIPEGWYLTVVNTPRGTQDVTQEIEIHEDGTRSFATWTTEKPTPATAKRIISGYNRRNFIERLFQDYQSKFSLTRTPHAGKRVLWFGIGMAFLSCWTIFRIRHGQATGEWHSGAYPLVYFLALIDPAIPRSILRKLGLYRT